MATVQQLAEQMAEQLETRTRDNGDSFVCLKDGRPEWMQELAHHAHGDMMPDDWRYRFIETSVDALADSEDEDDARMVAEEPSVYTSDLTSWLDSRNDRVYYLTEVLEETTHDDGFHLLAAAQSRERSEVFDLVLDYLTGMAEEADEEEDE